MAFSIAQLQQVIRDTYDGKDRRRGVEGTFMWLTEEIGELATALRSQTRQEQEKEFADVLAWLASLANIAGIDLERAVQAKYGAGCPRCGRAPCACVPSEKP
jgi:NTP pyrophosphatase (non-canonical NTP hydrolase)